MSENKVGRTIVSIDPSNVHSAFVVVDENFVVSAKGIVENTELCDYLKSLDKDVEVVIEGMQYMARRVGKDVFDTVLWIGIFYNICTERGIMPTQITRNSVRGYICKDMGVNDGDIRFALIERFGKTGTKKNPNPNYDESNGKMSADMWSALAIAVTYVESPRTHKKFIEKCKR